MDDRVVVPRCNVPLQPYLTMAAKQRQASRGPVLLGDFSATHFACPCCPEALKRLNPDLKVVVMLREPVLRAHSRFMEQIQLGRLGRVMRGQPHGLEVGFNLSLGFVGYVDWMLPRLEACMREAQAEAEAEAQAEAEAEAQAGAEAGPREGGLGDYLRMQCLMWDHVIGFSVYDLFLENYWRVFPESQVLVSYMETLARDPLAVLRAVEAHVGAPHHTYDASVARTVYNAAGCGWRCANATTTANSSGSDDSGGGSDGGGRGGGSLRALSLRLSGAGGRGRGGGKWTAEADRGNVTAMEGALERLRGFFAPSMRRLIAWADQGRIPQVPESWRELYS
ncbi:hypothetical protein HYH03_005263 [Edaphochlamys debaryana]|uniref:Sulfotransferase n=1 Tax=Edaphochlamys debaryana TaxID=47281 RepID=A0A835Y6E4_9CHLO|nr:hypothetical protein HYH03_005263 [Edaphochlamys debaryana]|eukprot:KAG2496861.1 hypothetical protein HYH03_005263 [Edaphochlamys debaryana]